MATITSSIGTSSRNYSTCQTWEDALPTDAVAAGNSYVGECYNDSVFAGVTFGGTNTDATHTLTLKAATGHSFRDNANVRTNALRASQANGVLITSNAGYVTTIDCGSAYVILDGLQVTQTNKGIAVNASLNTPQRNTVQNCICEANGGFALQFGNTDNVVLLQTGTAAGGQGLRTGSTATNYKTTIHKLGTLGTAGAIKNQYGTPTYKGVLASNWTTTADTSTNKNAASSNNATTSASNTMTGLAGLSLTALYIDQTTDLRLKSDAPVIDMGAAVGLAFDISGTARPQGAAYDVGAWEVAASGAVAATGTFAATLAAPSMASAGVVANPGALFATLAAPTFAASGIAATPPSGTLAASMPAPVMTSTGIALDAGQFSATMPTPTFAAIGTAAPNVTGTLAFTMPAPTMNAFGFLGAVAPAAPVKPYRWRILRRGFAPS